jgi:hypothetical protein
VNLSELSDEELLLMAKAPVDNLARQRARAGVAPMPKADNGLKAMSDDELLAIAGVSGKPKGQVRELEMTPGGSFAAPKAQPRRADDFDANELYSLGSSPESLRAALHAQEGEREKGPGFLERTGADLKYNITHPVERLSQGVDFVGSALTKGVNAATAGAYGAARNLIGGAIAPEANAAANATEGQFDREHPFVSGLAAGAGYLSPVGPANMVGRVAAKAGEGAAKLVPRLLERPVAGAVTGGLGAGGLGAAETLADGGSLQEAGEHGLRGLKYGGIAGGAIGAVQGGIGRLAEGADRRTSERNIADFTDGASATRRDRVIGKGGEKYDRIDSLARRTPELEGAAGDPIKQKPIVEAQIDRTGAQLDDIYDGVIVRPQAIVNPMREVAAEIRSKPHTGQQAAVADALEAEAKHVESTWRDFSTKGRERPIQPESEYTNGTSVGAAPREPTVRMSHDQVRELGYADRGFQPPQPEVGHIDARQARQMITDYGKGLYAGNPNNPAGIPKAIRQEVYRRQTDALRGAVEHFKPGVSEELNAANAEMSDWLNIHDAVSSRASRAQTPGMTLKKQSHDILDMALAATHPGHYLAKKGIEHFGPGAIRGIDRELSTGGAVLQEANPLIRALENEREQSRRRADALKNEQKTKQQLDEEERLRAIREALQQPN